MILNKHTTMEPSVEWKASYIERVLKIRKHKIFKMLIHIKIFKMLIHIKGITRHTPVYCYLLVTEKRYVFHY